MMVALVVTGQVHADAVVAAELGEATHVMVVPNPSTVA